MFNKIVVGILAFLLWIFPNDLGLRAMYQQRSFNMDNSICGVVEAINKSDANALEAMMCLNIKQNVEDLQGEIDKILDAIDEVIDSYSWTKGYSRDSKADGERLYYQSVDISFRLSDVACPHSLVHCLS